MSDNLDQRENFISGYISNQEKLYVNLLRMFIEVETKHQLLEQQLANLQSSNKTTDDMLAKALASISAFQSKNEELSGENAAQIENVNRITSEKIGLDDNYRLMLEAHAKLSADNQEHENELTRLKSDNKTLDDNYKLMLEAHAKLSADNQEHENELTRLKLDNKTLDDNYRLMLEAHAKLSADNQELTIKIDSIITETFQVPEEKTHSDFLSIQILPMTDTNKEKSIKSSKPPKFPKLKSVS